MYAIYLSSVWQGVEPNLTNPTKLKLTNRAEGKPKWVPGKKGSSPHKFDFRPLARSLALGFASLAGRAKSVRRGSSDFGSARLSRQRRESCPENLSEHAGRQHGMSGCSEESRIPRFSCPLERRTILPSVPSMFQTPPDFDRDATDRTALPAAPGISCAR
jgi:hypothetical protein